MCDGQKRGKRCRLPRDIVARSGLLILKLYVAIVERELAPAAENGTFSDFPKENRTIIACGDVILPCKITGRSKLPPYTKSETFSCYSLVGAIQESPLRGNGNCLQSFQAAVDSCQLSSVHCKLFSGTGQSLGTALLCPGGRLRWFCPGFPIAWPAQWRRGERHRRRYRPGCLLFGPGGLRRRRLLLP